MLDLSTPAKRFRFVAILEQYDWDPAAAFSSAEGQAFARDGAAVEVELDQVRTYLEEQCGIIDDSDEP